MQEEPIAKTATTAITTAEEVPAVSEAPVVNEATIAEPIVGTGTGAQAEAKVEAVAEEGAVGGKANL